MELKKLVVAFPLYRQVSSGWLMAWLQMRKAAVAGVIASEGVYITHAMEALTTLALKKFPDFDRLVVYEADMIPPVEAFDRIADYGDEHDIVGSVYFKHQPPHQIMAWNQPDPPFFEPIAQGDAEHMINNPDLYEIGGVAMGLTSISRRVLEDWDPDVPMWTPAPPLVGHDLHFCNEARKQGFRIWLDSGLGCGHLTDQAVGYRDWAAVSDKPQFLKQCERWQQRNVLRLAEPVDHDTPAFAITE